MRYIETFQTVEYSEPNVRYVYDSVVEYDDAASGNPVVIETTGTKVEKVRDLLDYAHWTEKKTIVSKYKTRIPVHIMRKIAGVL
jgi:protease II